MRVCVSVGVRERVCVYAHGCERERTCVCVCTRVLVRESECVYAHWCVRESV